MGIWLTNPADFTPGIAASFSHPLGLGDQRFRYRNSHRLQMLRIRKSRIDLSQRPERTDHQPGAHQQHQRHGHLTDDQQIPRAMLFPAHAHRPARIWQRAAAAWTGMLKSRNQSEEQSRKHRKNERKRQRSRIYGDFIQARQS